MVPLTGRWPLVLFFTLFEKVGNVKVPLLRNVVLGLYIVYTQKRIVGTLLYHSCKIYFNSDCLTVGTPFLASFVETGWPVEHILAYYIFGPIMGAYRVGKSLVSMKYSVGFK